MVVGMGNLCLHTVPVYEARTVAELASRVVEKQGKEPKVGDLEKLLGSSCASKLHILTQATTSYDFCISDEFWLWWRMTDKENRLLFQFLVLTAWLQRAENRGLELDLLVQIRDRFFSDPDKVESAVPFQDIHSKVPSVFLDLDRVLSPTNGVVVSGVLDNLKKELVELREDPVFRDDLDQLYKVFLKEMAQTARRKVQNCILSIM